MLSCAIEYMRAATMGNCKLVLISENISLPLFRRDVAWQFPVQLRLHFSTAPRTVLSSCPLRQTATGLEYGSQNGTSLCIVTHQGSGSVEQRLIS